MPQLNPASAMPLYAQLAEKLMGQIRDGEFAVGEKIPSENVLAARYGIGRPTVRQATDLMVRRGYLERKRGSGTYVRERSTHVDLFSLGGTLSSFNQQGLELTTRIVQAPELTEPTDDGHPLSGRKVYAFERLGSVEDEPVLLEKFWFDAEIFPFLDQVQIAGRSLSEAVMERYRLEATSAEQTFSVASLWDEAAALLEVSSGTAVLHVERLLDFQTARAAALARMWVRTDRFQFSQRLGAKLGADG